MARIPFNAPAFLGNEVRYIAEAITNRHISGDGPFTRRAQQLLQDLLPGSRVLLTTSCTHALEMAALLLDLKPGDEVLLPSFTFVSTANAFALRGAIPVFVDVCEDTLNLDERLLEAAITKNTRAIVVVHYAGVACEMDEVLRIGAKFGIPVVEDNAHGLFATYRGRPLGTLGTLATQSFHETKNITCGEGGALVINDEKYVERAEVLREKGTNRARFFRGQVDKYTWVDLGSSYVMSDVLAAMLAAQLEERARIQTIRKGIWERYARELDSWARQLGVRLPFVPQDREQSFHMFYLLMPDLEMRSRFIEHLRALDIAAVFHYVPLHRAPEALRLGVTASCPVADMAGDRLVRLPFYNSFERTDQGRVIEAVRAFRA